MGALSVLRWATRHPDQAAGLIPSGMGVIRPGAPGRVIPPAEPVPDEVLLVGAERGFTPGFPSASPELYQRYLRLRATATRIEAFRHPRTASFSNPSRDELAGLAGGIRSPVQIVVGELDWLADAGAHLHELVKQSQFAVVPGAPHNVYFEAAAQYNEIVSAFLAGLDLPG